MTDLEILQKMRELPPANDELDAKNRLFIQLDAIRQINPETSSPAGTHPTTNEAADDLVSS